MTHSLTPDSTPGNFPSQARAQARPQHPLQGERLPHSEGVQASGSHLAGWRPGLLLGLLQPPLQRRAPASPGLGLGRRAGQRAPAASTQAASHRPPTSTPRLSEGGLPAACSSPLPAGGPAFALEKHGLPAPASAPTHLCTPLKMRLSELRRQPLSCALSTSQPSSPCAQ